MTQPGKRSFSPDTIRKLAIGWMAFVVVAGLIAFVILLTTLNNRAHRLAAETQEATDAALTEVAAVETQISPTATPEVEETAEEGAEEGAEATVTPPTTTGLNTSLELGGQVPGYIAHPEVMQSASMTWVKYQIKWNADTDPMLAADMVNGGHENGFKVLLSIVGEPYPQPPIDYEGYVAFLGEVAAYQPDAIEVWNEMNLNREWPEGQQSPTDYVDEMLAPAYAAIKAVSPQTSVIIGALAPTGLDDGVIAWSDARYVAGLADAGAADYADCIGVHHNSGTTAPSATTGHVSDSGDGHYSWYFLPTIEVYYEGMDGELPVCLTEYGYFTPDGFDGPVPENFAWGAENTVVEQALWLAEGAQIAQDLGYVELMIVWNVDFDKWEADDPQAGYAILRPDGTCPACITLTEVVGG